MKERLLKISISLLACTFSIGHLTWPGLKIDAIVLTLFGIAIIPWLGSIFKSLEMPGGWKFEFKDFASAAKNAEESGLLAPVETVAPKQTRSNATYFELLDAYPRLAVLGLRIDIEMRIRELANRNEIADQKLSATTLARQLAKLGVLSGPESAALLGILTSLNAVVHGADVTRENAEQVLEVGKRLIDSLDERLK